MSCDTKSNGHMVPSNATGYTIRSSANIDLVKNSANALAINDTNKKPPSIWRMVLFFFDLLYYDFSIKYS